MRPPFAAVYFDCDSTLSSIEGIDELLKLAGESQSADANELAQRAAASEHSSIDDLLEAAGRRADIVELTRKAMEGTLPLAEVYEARLRLLAPRRAQLDRIGELYVQHVVPHAREVVHALQHVGKHVGILSGGLLVPVHALARHLGIPLANVHAVPLFFDGQGGYVDFDRSSPLWRNRGKIEVVQRLPADHRPLAFVGDGITDLETQGHVELFVGFGGVVARPAVKAGAQAFVAGKTLAPILAHVLTERERARLAADQAFAPVLAAAGA
ncbi:MAG TPA: HAD family hydrolase [Planctomycetota bacterium]